MNKALACKILCFNLHLALYRTSIRPISPDFLALDSVLTLGQSFATYEGYTHRMESYRKRQWTCVKTGRGGLTFEEVLALSRCCLIYGLVFRGLCLTPSAC